MLWPWVVPGIAGGSSCRGDLASAMEGAAASPLPVLKSPRQTIQVSDIQWYVWESFVAKKVVVVASGRKQDWLAVGDVKEDESKWRQPSRI